MPRILMTDRLPTSIEICTRDRGGRPCGAVLYRPQPNLVRCHTCGGREPGVVYLKSDRDDTTLGNMTRHLRAWRWRLSGWRIAVDIEWRARPRGAAPVVEDTHG